MCSGIVLIRAIEDPLCSAVKQNHLLGLKRRDSRNLPGQFFDRDLGGYLNRGHDDSSFVISDLEIECVLGRCGYQVARKCSDGRDGALKGSQGQSSGRIGHGAWLKVEVSCSNGCDSLERDWYGDLNVRHFAVLLCDDCACWIERTGCGEMTRRKTERVLSNGFARKSQG